MVNTSSYVYAGLSPDIWLAACVELFSIGAHAPYASVISNRAINNKRFTLLGLPFIIILIVHQANKDCTRLVSKDIFES
jgi:hypothetical protein